MTAAYFDKNTLLLAKPGPRSAALAERSGLRAVQPRAGAPKVIGCVAGSLAARAVVPALAATLAGRRRLDIVTDDPRAWLASSFPLQVLPAAADANRREKAMRYWIVRGEKSGRRVLADLAQDTHPEELSGLLLGCHEVLWLVEPHDLLGSANRLAEVLHAAPGLAARVRLLWLQPAGDKPMPGRSATHPALAATPFQLRLENGQPVRRDLARLGNHLNGVSLGLALGGGGARGAAHVGVLRALERAGIFVDALAGTSMGAIVAVAYASGLAPDHLLDLIRHELAASWKWRLLPGGRLAHMAYMYRKGGWRKTAARFLGEVDFDQLQLPVYTISADLISGRPVVRHQGNAIDALMESINYPGLAAPILRDGMALVDGGILNNVPSDIVRERGANLVLAVDVAGKFNPGFGSYDPDGPPTVGRGPSALETLARVIQVQMRALNTKSPTDLLISPDTTGIGFTHFHRAHVAAELGEAAAERALPALQALLANSPHA